MPGVPPRRNIATGRSVQTTYLKPADQLLPIRAWEEPLAPFLSYRASVACWCRNRAVARRRLSRSVGRCRPTAGGSPVRRQPKPQKTLTGFRDLSGAGVSTWTRRRRVVGDRRTSRPLSDTKNSLPARKLDCQQTAQWRLNPKIRAASFNHLIPGHTKRWRNGWIDMEPASSPCLSVGPYSGLPGNPTAGVAGW